MSKRITVVKETKSGRNALFRDNYTNHVMTGKQFVTKILNGQYKNYRIRTINSVPTPVSNPDNSTNNNLN